MRRLLAVTSVALILVACKQAPGPIEARVEPERAIEPVATPAQREGPVAPAPSLVSGRAGEIEQAYAREAFDDWRAHRAAEVAPATVSHRVDEISRCRNCEDLIVTERIAGADGSCREGPWVLYISGKEGQAASFEAKQVASDCCDEACRERSPAGWLLVLNEILVAHDAAGLRALVSPTRGLAASRSHSGGEETSDATVRVKRGQPVDEVFTTLQPVQLLFDTIECPAAFDGAGAATCEVHGGGFRATYEWRREGAAAYLLSAEQETH